MMATAEASEMILAVRLRERVYLLWRNPERSKFFNLSFLLGLDHRQ